MPADNVVKFPRQRIAAVAHASSCGPSWPIRLGAGARRSRFYLGSSEIGDDLERLDAELAVDEAEHRALELAVAEAVALEPHMTPVQVAELAIGRARLKANRVNLDQCYRSRRRIQAQRTWGRIKGLLILVFLFWLMTTFAGAAQAQSTSRLFYDEQGRYAGQSTTRGKWTNFTDGQGRFAGSAVRHGKWKNFHDEQGRYSGSVIDTSPRRATSAAAR
jgi:hypothetical protein